VTGDGDPAAQLRERLVDTAAALVAEGQVSAITTRQIARAAGVSDGVLYNYFADKNELLVAALVRHFEIVASRSQGELPTAGSRSVEENLVTYGEALYDVIGDTFPMFAGLMGDHALLGRVMAEIHRPGQGILPFLNRIGEYLVEEQRLGRIGDVDIEAAMALFTGACATLTMGAHFGLHAGAEQGSGSDAREQLGRVVQVLMRGIT
jgi:AcrR family transcriptional regulator